MKSSQKMRHLILSTILFLIFGLTGFSQEKKQTKTSELEISTTYVLGHYKNLSFAPVSKYDYNTLAYQLKFVQKSSTNSLFEIELRYFTSDLESDIIPQPNPEYSKYIFNVSSLIQVYDKNDLRIHLGGQLQSNLSTFFDGQPHDFQQKLGFAGRLYYSLNEKNVVSSGLVIPLLLWRTSTFDKNWYALGKYQGLLFFTEYAYDLSNELTLKASCQMQYDRLKIFNAYRELQYHVGIGINYKF